MPQRNGSHPGFWVKVVMWSAKFHIVQGWQSRTAFLQVDQAAVVYAAKPIKHGRRVWWWWRERESETWVPHGVALSGLLSCCSISLVCVWRSNGTRPQKRTSLVFCTLLYECLALFLMHPPGASQQNTLFQTNSRQMQTLHSIMTSGEHSNGIAPVRELDLER